MNINLITGGVSLIIMHTLIWFSTNLQLVDSDYWKEKSLMLAVMLAIPISLLSFYSTKQIYVGLNGTAWGVRLFAFGFSYISFPILTWMILKESMFTPKTLCCIGLSVLIVLIQIFWK